MCEKIFLREMLVLSELSFLLGRPPTYGSSDDFEGEKEGRRKHTHSENETCLIGGQQQYGALLLPHVSQSLKITPKKVSI